ALPRSLLAPAPEPDGPAPLDVGCEADPPEPAPALPGGLHDGDAADDRDDEGDDDWEARLAAQAPTPALARLTARVADVLRDLRLARLAAGPRVPRALRQDQARAAAARLRRALAPAWAWGGAAGWLQALGAALPGAAAARLRDVLLELRRAAPRLAARLPPAAAPPATEAGGAGPAGGPLVVWVSAGRARADARWERRLRACVCVRTVRAPPAAPAPAAPAAPAPPERWCAAQAAGARAALADVLADAGSRAVILCGFGAGAALASALAGGGVRGLALLGAAEAEAGAGSAPTVPWLARAAGGGRLVLVEGADAALRLPARTRRRLRLPQAALDAAIAEEVAVWAREVAEGSVENERSRGASPEHEDYAHLPAPAEPDTNPSCGTPTNTRAIEIVEGRVVARVSGSTPLLLPPRMSSSTPQLLPPRVSSSTPLLLPPRRAAPLAVPAPADIMQMPIVFADDEPAPPLPASPMLGEQQHLKSRKVRFGPVLIRESSIADASGGDSPVTVTSGGSRGGAALKYTRVIVAKRGASARPVLLRRVLGRGRGPR
ncbi:translation initiation factor IF-2-like, partial [Pectinophora gossypiella]|uniref:translation initiation factor IF-2-like n=1 Tax=Pectinophora gossypiella TaxID=13191 RepID=UPI00214E0F13